MTRQDELADDYDAARPRLIRVAYAILGSHAEAEDVVSDVWLRLPTADTRDPIQDVAAWATVVVARAALDALHSARRRRETYVGPWLPEPLIDASTAVADPAERVTLDDTVSFALLVVLESLTPAERTSWVLHDLFGMPFAEVADTVGRSPQAVRQLAARARAHLAERAPRLAVGPQQHARAVGEFLRAASGGKLAALIATLDPEVVLTTDGGGEVRAARRPLSGSDRVARFLLGIIAKIQPGEEIRSISVNGAVGYGVFRGDRPITVVSLTVSGDKISRVDIVRAPGKLSRAANGD